MANVIKVNQPTVVPANQPTVVPANQPTATQSNAIANVAAQAAAAIQAVQEQVAASNGSAATKPVTKPILIKPTLQQLKPIIATPVSSIKTVQEAVTTQLASNGDAGLALKSAMTSAGGVDAGETTVTKGSQGSPETKGEPSEPEYEDYEDDVEETNPNRKWWLIGGIGGGVLLIAIVVIIIVAMRKRK